jgi:3-oxoacyl-[acyl-carrier protein] reductase
VESLAADNGTKEGCMATISAFPENDILVNNLGIYEVVSFFEETDEIWQHQFEVNILSGVRLSRHYLKKMLGKRKGRIVLSRARRPSGLPKTWLATAPPKRRSFRSRAASPT